MSLVLNTDDVPTNKDLEQGISRLRHCAELLARVGGKKHEDPEALRRIANFLEMLSKK